MKKNTKIYKDHPLLNNNPFELLGLGGSGSQPAGYTVASGPTQAAASAAANAEISASQAASQVAQEDTQSAIQALMGEYSTALTYANPAINTGNQALAQLNYVLGLPAVSPGAAPTAPNAPTLASIEATITPAQISQYIQQNTNVGQVTAGGNTFQGAEFTDPISGFQSGQGNVSQISPANMGENPTTENADISQYLAQQQLSNPNSNPNTNYQNALTTYNQQNAQWQQQEGVYNTYSAMGQATPADIGNIVNNLPGFQFTQQQGINSIQNAASASGMLNSGSLLRQLDQYGQGLASQYYNNYVGQLQGVAGIGQQATNTVQQGATNVGNTSAGLLNSLGTTQANAYLAAGAAQASSYLSPAANQQSIVSPYGSQNTSSQTLGAGLGLLGNLFGGL